jgi:hypothetical protein
MPGVVFRFRHVRMGKRRISQDADDLVLRQHVPIVQRKQERLHDRQRGGSGNIQGVGHHQQPFQAGRGQKILPNGYRLSASLQKSGMLD